MLENIDSSVNKELVNQGVPTPTAPTPTAPTAPAAAPTTPPVEPTVQPGLSVEQVELNQLRHENEQLRAEASATAQQHDSDLAGQRLKTAVAEAHKPATRLGCGMQDVALAQAISACGGPAYWHQLSPQQQAEALGAAGSDTPDKVIRQYFGSTSNATEAQRLARQNPNEYKRMRLLAKLRRIF